MAFEGQEIVRNTPKTFLYVVCELKYLFMCISTVFNDKFPFKSWQFAFKEFVVSLRIHCQNCIYSLRSVKPMSCRVSFRVVPLVQEWGPSPRPSKQVTFLRLCGWNPEAPSIVLWGIFIVDLFLVSLQIAMKVLLSWKWEPIDLYIPPD